MTEGEEVERQCCTRDSCCRFLGKAKQIYLSNFLIFTEVHIIKISSVIRCFEAKHHNETNRLIDAGLRLKTHLSFQLIAVAAAFALPVAGYYLSNPTISLVIVAVIFLFTGE